MEEAADTENDRKVKSKLEENKTRKRNGVDDYYAWLVVVMCFLIYIISGGVYYTGGIILPELLASFPDTDSASATLVVSLTTSTMNFSVLFSGCFCEVYGLRKVCLAGSFLISLGFFGSAFVTHFSPLYITYGTIIGIGVGVQFLPCVVILQRYFPRRHALATSFVSTGSSIGVFIFAVVIRWLIDIYAWRGALLMMSGIALHAVAFAMFLVPPAAQETSSCDEDVKIESTVDSAERNKILTACSNNIQQLLKSMQKVASTLMKSVKDLSEPKFGLFVLTHFFKALEMGVPYVMLPVKLLLLGYSNWQVASLVAIMGAGDLLGRLLVGILSVACGINTTLIFSFSLLLAGLTEVAAGLTDYYYGLCVCAFLLAMCAGLTVASLPPLLVDLVGFERVPRSYGLSSTGRGIAGLIGLPLVAAMYEFSGNINIALFFCASFPVLGFIFMNLVYVLQRRSKADINES